MDALTTVYKLAVAIKGVHDGVKGNKEQCKLLNDQVQVVATSLRGLPAATLKTKSVKNGVASLRETLRSALDLIGGFKRKNWFTRMLSHSSITEKFEALFVELDRVLAVCGFALNVSHFSLYFLFLFFSFSLSLSFFLFPLTSMDRAQPHIWLTCCECRRWTYACISICGHVCYFKVTSFIISIAGFCAHLITFY